MLHNKIIFGRKNCVSWNKKFNQIPTEMKEFFTPAVIWFLVGLVLLLLELAIPGLIIIFFGVGAWITSLSLLIFKGLGINPQLIIFLLSSIFLLALLRKYLRKRFFGETKEKEEVLEDEFIGKIAQVKSSITPNIPGKIEFKGTHWSATSNEEIPEGSSVEIIDKDNITLKVKKIN